MKLKFGRHLSLGTLIEVHPDRQKLVYGDVFTSSVPSAPFYIMVALSAVIAAYGLLENSIAIVIGAMLVAPLMGPIFGIGLGLVSGDRLLLRCAIVSEIFGTAVAVGVAALIGLVPLRTGFGAEILARTQPTIYDIIIAVAAGLAGTYAQMNERISPALPGVAIATSLVPPLAVCGLCVSAARWEQAGGAFLLFFANFLAIELASAFVFFLHGMETLHTPRTLRFGDFVRRFGLSLVLLAAIGVFMAQTLVSMVSTKRLSDAVQRMLSEQLRSILGAQLSSVEVERRRDKLNVVGVVLTPQQIGPDIVGQIEEKLQTSVSPDIHLIVRSLISRDADRSGPVFMAEEEKTREQKAIAQTNFLSDASSILRQQLASVTGAQLVDIQREEVGGRSVVTAIVRTPTPVEPTKVAEMETALNRALPIAIRLVVRSVLTRDADSMGYINAPTKPVPRLSKAEQAFHTRVEEALTSQLKLHAQGSSLVEFSYQREDGRLLIYAVATTPRPLEPAQVRTIEKAFRDYVDPNTDLTVRYRVEADATSTGLTAAPSDSGSD